jgi:dolichol-phosphate mannosyltransferase
MSRPLPSLSVVVPVRDEAPNIEPLAAEIEAAMVALPDWECIWVDDASADPTPERLRALGVNPHHRVLRFPEHRGQTAALLAGWRFAHHEFVGALDGDRQNDPADLVRLLVVAAETGLDMVNGVRARRRDTWTRRVSSRIANGFRNLVTGDHITDVGCSVRVLRRSFVAAIPALKNMHRFLPTLVRLAGGRVGEAPVSHRPRAAGRTKYGIHNRLWVGIVDSLAIRWMVLRAVSLAAVLESAPLEAEAPGAGPGPGGDAHAAEAAVVEEDRAHA